MNIARTTLFFILLIFISCSNPPISDPLFPVPVINVKMGEKKIIDLSKYFRKSNIILQHNPSSENISLDYNTLIIDATLSRPGVETISLFADGQAIKLIVNYQKMIKHTFTYESAVAEKVIVMGGFNDWSRTALPLGKNETIFRRTLFIDPSKHSYKFVVDGIELIDPMNPESESNNMGGWNSVLDFSSKSDLDIGSLIKVNHDGRWLHFNLVSLGLDISIQEWIVLVDNTQLHADDFDPVIGGGLRVNIGSIDSGLLRVFGIASNGKIIPENQTIIKNGKPLSADNDDWHFSVIYNIMVDRFFDGDKKINKPVQNVNVSNIANFMGGDFLGIQKKMDEGYFENLGINSFWISPIQEQANGGWREWAPPNRVFTAYHGYWPIEPRKIESRFGTDEEFKSIVKTAHRSGKRVLLDFVSNHVHKNHRYYKNQNDWFGEITLADGSLNIRKWDGETRLTTWFDEFLPSFNYTLSKEAIDTVVGDAIWWMQEYDLDGFRQDAVKHVPHSFWKELTKQIKTKLPQKNIYQIGETFGSDDLIKSYVNPSELNAQFNFSIYFNVRELFSSDNTDFSSIKGVIDKNRSSFGPIHQMGNITSSHDQLRFAGYADGQIGFGDDGTSRSFTDQVGPIQNETTYSKLANFHAFNISQPGIPIIYYGEEIGLMGEGDPGNRRMMRFDLDDKEKKLKSHFSKLNKLRTTNPALALGDQLILKNEGTILVILKVYYNHSVLVIINNGSKKENIPVTLPFNPKQITSLTESLEFIKDGPKLIFNTDSWSYYFYAIQN